MAAHGGPRNPIKVFASITCSPLYCPLLRLMGGWRGGGGRGAYVYCTPWIRIGLLSRQHTFGRAVQSHSKGWSIATPEHAGAEC